MTNVLALDTSSDQCSVSLYHNGSFFSLAELAPRKHAQLLLPMIQQLLADQNVRLADLDVIAFGCGPGSFTGLRIAAGVTQGLAFGLGCKVVPVSTLKALALQASEEFLADDVLVAVDARMDEVYWSLNHVNRETCDVGVASGERVTSPEMVSVNEERTVLGVGSGFQFVDRMPQDTTSLIERLVPDFRSSAEAVCKLALKAYLGGECCDPADAAPVYVRDEVAWKKLPGKE